MGYRPWLHAEDHEALAWIEEQPPELEEDDYRLSEGLPARGWFPGSLRFTLSRDSGVRVADSIPNVLSLLIVSDRLKQALEVRANSKIEFLPVSILNKKKRPLVEPYYVANLLGSIACMDREKSEFKMNAVLKDQVLWFARLVLDEPRIPPKANLFRLREQMDLVLVRDDLADVLAKFTGLRLPPLDEYGAEYRRRR
jgi:hypothetical protein